MSNGMVIVFSLAMCGLLHVRGLLWLGPLWRGPVALAARSFGAMRSPLRRLEGRKRQRTYPSTAPTIPDTINAATRPGTPPISVGTVHPNAMAMLALVSVLRVMLVPLLSSYNLCKT